MQDIRQAELVQFPNSQVKENFSFDVMAEAGTFSFHFKWLNDRWNLWVTLPSGEVREAGVQPNVVSWSGFEDFGLIFKTSMPDIAYENLFLTEVYIITWQ